LDHITFACLICCTIIEPVFLEKVTALFLKIFFCFKSTSKEEEKYIEMEEGIQVAEEKLETP
jgi:hypothetical protein